MACCRQLPFSLYPHYALTDISWGFIITRAPQCPLYLILTDSESDNGVIAEVFVVKVLFSGKQAKPLGSVGGKSGGGRQARAAAAAAAAAGRRRRRRAVRLAQRARRRSETTRPSQAAA